MEVKPDITPLDPQDMLRIIQHHADLSVHHARKAANAAQELSRVVAARAVSALCKDCNRYPAESGSDQCFGCEAYQDALKLQDEEAARLRAIKNQPA